MSILNRRTWPFEVANAEQAELWDGREGEEWTRHADRFEAAVRRYDAPLINAARITRSDHVLDVGCGSGISTRDAAKIAARGRVLGIDLSSQLLDEARNRVAQEGLGNVAFVQGDAQVHPFEPGSFHVVISRFGSMFFADPVAAFTNLGRALRPGGRLALLTWREFAANDWLRLIREALSPGRMMPDPPSGAPGPFGLADPNEVRDILATAGFDDIDLTSQSHPLLMGADPDDAFTFITGMGLAQSLLNGLNDNARPQALQELRARLTAHATPTGVLLNGSAWLITAHHP